MTGMIRPNTLALCLILFVSGWITGCQTPASHQNDGFYDQLGQRSGIADIVEDLLFLIVDDARINQSFKGVDVQQFHRHLTDQLCELSGGPCEYTGRSMRELHADMAITDTQFNALTENLILAMEKNRVPVGAQNRLLEKLVPLYPDIRNL